jgi:DNA polymerase I-like protein with 3'-5' exonuclease and polymerase domains
MVIFDIEADNFLDDVTTIHVINVLDRETGERFSFHDHPDVARRDGTLEDGVTRLRLHLDEGELIAGHNIIRYDIPVIQKFFPDFIVHPDLVLDTLVVSRLIWTDLKGIDQRAMRKGKRPAAFKTAKLAGSHSLEAWGYRLGVHKGEFKGPWDTFTPEMAEYAIQDPETTLALLEHIEKQNYSEEAIRLEHRVAEIIFLQERFGVYFYKERAEALAQELQGELAEMDDRLRSAFDPWFEAERKYGKAVIMDPKVRRRVLTVSEDGEEWRAEYAPGSSYCKVKLVSFEPTRQKIANRLKAIYGWKPTEFTPTGQPELNENTLAGLDYPQVKLLVRYLVLKKLIGTISTGKKAWLKVVSDDGRIHSQVNTNGAVTGRMTHADHLAQVPRMKYDEHGKVLKGYEGRYGYESRSLFGAPPGKKLVGVDADGLELRKLGHYMARYDDGAYARAVVDGDKKLGTDAHSLNMKAVGLRTRDGAKTWIYAYLYGAGDLKLGLTHYEDMTEEWRDKFNADHPPGPARERALINIGRRGRKRIETTFPALDKLQKEVRSRAKSKAPKLKSLDGRLLHIRAQHSALNTLLQGGGAVVMKKALVLAYDSFLAQGWEFGREFAFVLNVHDEFQMEVIPEYAEKVGALASEAIRLAGEAFDLRVPLAGTASIGQTWADTH